jgi:carbamoyl-phosphate synthase large subunit
VHRAGANFAKWLLEPVLGLPGTANNQWKDGIAMLRYDAAYFSSPGPL